MHHIQCAVFTELDRTTSNNAVLASQLEHWLVETRPMRLIAPDEYAVPPAGRPTAPNHHEAQRKPQYSDTAIGPA